METDTGYFRIDPMSWFCKHPIFTATVGLFGGALITNMTYQWKTRFQRRITVASKSEEEHYGPQGEQYLMLRLTDTDDRTYYVSPATFYLFFNNWEMWNGLREGGRYDVVGYGWNGWGFVPNIISADPVDEQ